MQAKTVRFVWLLGVGSLSACLFSACNGDEDLVPAPETPVAGAGGESPGAGGESHGAGSPECEAIGRICHDADTGSGTANECHTTGHEGDAAACSAIFASCIHTCVPDEGGHAGESGHDAAPHCRALGSLCHDADTGPGRGRECHNVGHAGDEEACVEEFDDCVTFCLAAGEHSGAGGAGGADGHAGGQAGAHEQGAGGHAGAQDHAASGASGEHAGGHGGG